MGQQKVLRTFDTSFDIKMMVKSSPPLQVCFSVYLWEELPWLESMAADGMWLKLKFHRPIVLFPMKKSWENWESILELTMSILLYWLCQNITIKLWMWPLTNDLILKDPISSSKNTEKD